MTKPRPVFPNTTVFSTRRVHKRQLLLRPDPRVNAVVLYVIAVLVERYGIQLHALCVMSNHKHDVCTDPAGHIVEFQRDCHAFIARHLNALFGDFEAMWAREPTCRVECQEPDDIIDKLIYTMCNPVEARLVERGRHWPGVRRAWPAKPLVVRRPAGFFRSGDQGGEWPDVATLEFVRPPGFDDSSDAELAARLSAAITAREDEICRAARAAGQRFLGRRAVRKQSRYAFPSRREERFQLRPTLACRSKWLRIERLQRKQHWEVEYAEALALFRAGDHSALFPYGTFKLRSDYQIACRPPPIA